jgi:hypothetical protein
MNAEIRPVILRNVLEIPDSWISKDLLNKHYLEEDEG